MSHFGGPTIEKIRAYDLKVLVFGQGVHKVCCTRARETEDWGQEVSDARLEQEQRHPLWDELQRCQVVGLLC